ncbi:MAG: hypothetical protein H6604_02450 [Flavobacteriales bacterium]|nr:hypothetical protein [Flavobacteriales bacterium]
MKETINFFHPDETFVYNVKKFFCKIVFQNKKRILVLEIQSTDELHHVEEDSIQNEFPEIALTIEDAEIEYSTLDDLTGNTIEIPISFEEKTNSDGEIEEFFYTNLNVNDEVDVELNKNKLTFSKDKNNNITLKWTGIADDFTDSDIDEGIPFEVNCTLKELVSESSNLLEGIE